VDSPDFWEEFFTAMSSSDHPKNGEIVSQFLGYKSDPVEAEKKVRELIKNDQTVRDILFPDLRYSSIRVNFNRAAMDQEQLVEAARLYPAILSAKELTRVAESELTLERKACIYQSAIKLYPTSWELYANLGNVYLKMKDYEAARNTFTDALKLDPNNAKLKAQLAYTYLAMGDFDKASQILNGVNGAEADYYRGIILLAKGKSEEAIPLLKNRTDVNLAIAQLNVRNTKDAYQTLQKLDQENVYTAFYTGVALRRLNRSGEAEMFFNKARQLNNGELNDRLNVDYVLVGI
jgi:tetratricopeptide (TPR) repeat protein